MVERGPLAVLTRVYEIFFFKIFLVVDGHNNFIFSFYVVLRIEPSASHRLGKHSTTEPQPQPLKFPFNDDEFSSSKETAATQNSLSPNLVLSHV